MKKLKPSCGVYRLYKVKHFKAIEKKEHSLGSFSLKSLLIMKLVFIILIATGLQATAMSSEAQSVTLKGKNLPLSTIFKKIRNQTGYQFFYKDEYLEKAKPVNISVKEVPVK
ncbi:MAG TPA: hypothetical protein VK084_08905, partial [Chitinophagaceae bacterium]|nr:hypothetical protein [Chitinophagaceae bacterium]